MTDGNFKQWATNIWTNFNPIWSIIRWGPFMPLTNKPTVSVSIPRYRIAFHSVPLVITNLHRKTDSKYKVSSLSTEFSPYKLTKNGTSDLFLRRPRLLSIRSIMRFFIFYSNEMKSEAKCHFGL
jgi:hypothetical protein